MTAGTVVSPDLKRAEIYAVNKVFSERYGKQRPLGDDLFNKQRDFDLPADPINEPAQRCYQPNTTDNNGGCLVSVSRVVVFPWVSDQRKFGLLTAEVLSPAQGKTQDVAVLRIGAQHADGRARPVGPATKVNGVLGFSDVPTGKLESQAQLIGHLAAGGLPFDEDEVLPKPSRKGWRPGAAGRWSPRPAR